MQEVAPDTQGRPPAPPQLPTVRSEELDVLRGVAVLLVFTRHVNGLPFSTMGWIGVDLFFVLSGFLISGLLFDEYRESGRVRIKTFLLRRAFKIYPQFYVFLAISLAVLVAMKQSPATVNFFAEAAFFQNYHQGVWTHTWSLAIEEHFYLLVAASVALFQRLGGNIRHARLSLPGLIVGAAALILVLRIITALTLQPFDFSTHFSASHLRMDSLLAGVWLAHQFRYNRAALQSVMAQYRYPLSIASIACLAPTAFLPLDHIFIYTIGLTFVYIGFSILLLLVLFPERPSKQKPMGFAGLRLAGIGRNSYGIYLWQGPVILLCEYARAKAESAGFPVSQVSFFLLAFIPVLAVGILMTSLVERPFLHLRERMVPRRNRG